MCSNNTTTLYVSHFMFAALHLSCGAVHSCSNCSSLDSMEAVIGHPRYSDQSHRYNQDLRHTGLQTVRPSRGQRGTGREGAK